MINGLIHVFDNIGTKFTLSSNTFVLGSALKGYNSLNPTHIGSYVPYIVRNTLNNNVLSWEVGLGKVVLSGADIGVERVQVVESSNNNEAVDFNFDGDKTFFVFANEKNFNVGFNNIVLKDGDFSVDNVNATYVVDISDKNIVAKLPQASDNQGLEVRFKTIGDSTSSFSLNVKSGEDIVSYASGSDRYLDLISTGESWIELKDSKKSMRIEAEDFSSQSFSALSVQADGDDRSLQFNDNGILNGSAVYYSSNNELLLGSSLASGAHVVLPVSGSGDIVFNNDNTNANFLVKGSGNRNLMFTYDGRIGLNIPSGVRPQTIFHLINYSCQEGMRFENRSSCHPANITLYHKPASNIDSNSTVATVSLSAKNSAGNKVDYATIESKAVSSSAGQTKGQLDIVVDNAGVGVTGLVITPDQASIGYSNNGLIVNNNGNNILGTSTNNITINNSSISLQSSSISIGTSSGTVNIPKTLTSDATVSNKLNLPFITPNTLLTVNSSGNLVGGSVLSIPSIPSGRILTTSASGTIVGTATTADYFLTTKDFTWNKYSSRLANICLKQVAFIDSDLPSIPEFIVGDQVAIVTDATTYYRTIQDLEISGGKVISLLVNQNLTLNTLADVKVYSVTRGGYLESTLYVEPGTVSDNTANILSIRPNKDTVFNTKQKDINFLVYGTDTTPSLEVFANVGSIAKPTGTYNNYSTQNGCSVGVPYPISVNSSGVGAGNTNNTLNFNYAASGSWVGMVTEVGSNGQESYYGTYDQNGNVAEWVQDSQKNSNSTIQYAAGGAWDTDEIAGLKSIVPLPYSSGYENVGFRVSSSDGLVDSPYVTGTLGLEFVTITEPHNFPDVSGVNILDGEVYAPTGIADLGTVPYLYRISKYEVTNNQYVSFLNAVAVSDPYGLYDTNMESSDIGGIDRSGTDGSYSYETKIGMGDMPVAFVDYLSSIRFVNWLHNGTPTDPEDVTTSTTEDGAYTITATQNQYLIERNTYTHYSLPTLNEWHKAAYYEPQDTETSLGTSAVTIKRDGPYLLSSGNYASLSVSGYLYADNLKIDSGILTTESGNLKLVSNSGSLIIGNSGVASIFTPTGILLSTSGNVNVVSNGLYSSGIYATTIEAQNFIKVDSSGNTSSTYPGPIGSFLYKDTDNSAVGYSGLYFDVSASGGSGIKLDGTTLSPLYLDSENFIKQYENLTFNSDTIVANTDLQVPGIQIGSNNPFYSGSILTHNGSGNAIWAPATYLNAEGVSWTRYDKQKILVKDTEIVFTELTDISQLNTQFPYTDTIAIMNSETREVNYIKAADGNFIVDGSGSVTPSTGIFYSTEGGVGMKYCPEITWANCSGISGVAFSVNRGGYLSMEIEPSAISTFACSTADLASSPYRFKPSTLNTISIRPGKATSFNTLGEDIDFAIYGHKSTLYRRYEPALFGLDNNGLPSGLTPALKINAYTNNAAVGTLESGVIFSGYIDNNSTVPTGFTIDESAKTCINVKDPYIISTIPSGNETLALYADLTVNKYTYSSGIITNLIQLVPAPNANGTGRYVANAPLTINSLGQIVSQAPDTLPTVPGSPTALSGVAGNRSVSLQWLAPTKTGGKPITDYIVQYSSNSGANWSTYDSDGINTFVTVTGLNNSSYAFRVSAVNIVGTGYPSQTYTAPTPSVLYPGLITNLNITRQNTTARLTWTDPISIVSGYDIDYSIDNGATWVSVSPSISNRTATITGLSDALYYLFRIRAKNGAGNGGYTVAASVGTDPAPVIDDPSTSNVWDFGVIAFTGVCT